MPYWHFVTYEFLTMIYRSSNCISAKLESFCKENGFNRLAFYNGSSDLIDRIIKSGTFASRGYYREPDPLYEIPYIDHAIYLKNTKTGLCCLVYAPYDEADAIRSEVTEWSDRLGLEVEVYGSGWYSSACAVVVHEKGKSVKYTPPQDV